MIWRRDCSGLNRGWVHPDPSLFLCGQGWLFAPDFRHSFLPNSINWEIVMVSTDSRRNIRRELLGSTLLLLMSQLSFTPVPR